MNEQARNRNDVRLYDAVLAAGMWLLSVVVVPLLAVSALAFGAVAVMAPALGVLRTFGIDWVHMEIFAWKVPVLWSVPAALVISVVCGAFALGAAVMLRSYLGWMRTGFGAVR
jgi:hypothetical protein